MSWFTCWNWLALDIRFPLDPLVCLSNKSPFSKVHLSAHATALSLRFPFVHYLMSLFLLGSLVKKNSARLSVYFYSWVILKNFEDFRCACYFSHVPVYYFHLYFHTKYQKIFLLSTRSNWKPVTDDSDDSWHGWHSLSLNIISVDRAS